MNDGEEFGYNSLNLVSNPMNYFMGIGLNDYNDVLNILLEDEFAPPIIIEIQPNKKGLKVM